MVKFAPSKYDAEATVVKRKGEARVEGRVSRGGKF
jgi:hypothetical protein